ADSTQEKGEFVPELVVYLCANTHVQTLVLDAQVFEHDHASNSFVEKYLKENDHLKKLVWGHDLNFYPLNLFNALESNNTLVELNISRPFFFQRITGLRKDKIIHMPQIDALSENTT